MVQGTGTSVTPPRQPRECRSHGAACTETLHGLLRMLVPFPPRADRVKETPALGKSVSPERGKFLGEI